MEIATPWAGGSPASPHTRAAAPSRTPQPASVIGISIASSTGGTSASRVASGSWTPIARAAQTNTRA